MRHTCPTSSTPQWRECDACWDQIQQTMFLETLRQIFLLATYRRVD